MKRIAFFRNTLEGLKHSTNAQLVLKSVLCGFLISFMITMVSFDAQSKEISTEVLRLHILANSDSEKDQELKLSVRNVVQEMCYNIYDGTESKEDAERKVQMNLDKIIKAAQDEVYKEGYTYDVKGEIVNMYFTNRVYNDITLPAGYYDAVRITIGSGEGHNWWCVMFPPICISAAENEAEISDVLSDEQTELVTDSSYQYKFKVYEIYQNLMEKLERK